MKARSPIFAELLLNGTDSIKIDKFEPKIVKKMIEFCNNDSIENFENDELEMFSIANTYKIQSLMIYAARKTVKTATIENAIERYNFAVSQKSKILEKWFFNFIITNFVKVSNTSNFGNLDAKAYKLFLEELLKKNKIN
uniref:BTB domain-containing protein n=1 Tax=Panagrolaimus superbus TaxID=310955 RepID=A0A914XTB1_9BILA